MFDHVTIRVGDLDGSRRFYDLALGDPSNVGGRFAEWGDFGVAAASEDKPRARRLHVGFAVADRDAVERWWERMTSAGYESDGEPGERPQYSAQYYGAFVLDPDGNSVEAVHHEKSRPEPSTIDHLWLRSRDLVETKRFYEEIASVVGIRTTHDAPDRVQFSDGVGSFSFVAGGEPTEHVHLAFGVGDIATVEAFHRAATAGGYADNGTPGERPEYHAGYYGAFVLDADGHNVEAVFHDRRF